MDPTVLGLLIFAFLFAVAAERRAKQAAKFIKENPTANTLAKHAAHKVFKKLFGG